MLTTKPLLLLWGIFALIMMPGEAAQTPDLSKAEVTLGITPTNCMEHCTIQVAITIRNYEPDRQLCLAFHNDEAEPLEPADRMSCWPWSGRRITDITIRNIPAGSYDVIASLPNAGSQRAVRKLHVGGRYDVVVPDGPVPSSGNDAALFQEKVQWPE